MEYHITTQNLQGLEALVRIIDGVFPSTAFIAVERKTKFCWDATVYCIPAEADNVRFFVRRCSL